MKACPHAPRPFRLCEHLLLPESGNDAELPEHQLHFAGSEYTPMCVPCAEGTPALAESCDACRRAFLRTDTFGTFAGFGGTPPAPRLRDEGLALVAETVDVRAALGEGIRALAPISASNRAGWLALTDSWRLVSLELPSGRVLAELPAIPAERLSRPPDPDPADPAGRTPYPRLVVSPDGRHAAVLLERLRDGVVIDLANGSAILALDRKDYHPDVSGWPFAFARREGRSLAIHAVDWNLIAVTDLESGSRLGVEEEARGDNYFLGPLTVNPSATRLATAGWVWQPVGILKTLSIGAVLAGSGDLEPHYLNQTGYHWNGSNVWLDDERLLAWGLGDDDTRMVDAGVVYRGNGIDALWPGLHDGALHADRREGQVWCCGHAETSLWDAATGERIAHAPVRTNAFHPSLRHAAGLLDDGRISLVFLQRR